MLSFTVSPHGEHYLHDLQRSDFLERPSNEVFQRHFDVDFKDDDTLFVLVGSDSGLLVRWLASHGLGDGSRALFIEQEDYHEPIAALLEDVLHDGTMDMCTACEAAAELTVEAIGRWLYGGKVVLVESVGCYLGRSEQYTALARTLRTLLGERTHHAGVQLNGKNFIQVGIRNLTENRRAVGTIGRIGEGRTAMILGGGPSLDEHLDWVREHRGQLFVFAVSRIIDRLNTAGITPDAVVAVDPQDILYDISKAALDLDNVLLVNSYHVAPQLLQQWPGPHVYVGQAFPWTSSVLKDKGNTGSAGSTVTHTATWVAHSWGFSQLLLSGFDLCYTASGATHASGSLESVCADLPSNYAAHVLTYSGRRAGTSMPMKIARDELEAMGDRMRQDGTAVYNLAGDAARIDSISHREPQCVELVGQRPTLDLSNDRRSARPYWRLLKRELGDATRGLRAVSAGCRKAQSLLDELHGTGSRKKNPNSKGKLDTLERHLNGREKRWMDLVKKYAVLELVGTISPRGFEVQSDEELEKWGRDYYHIIDRSAKLLLEHVTAARRRVEHRLDELAESPDVPALIDYWEKDQTLGRVRFALDSSALEAADVERVAATECWLVAHLADRDTEYSRLMEAQKSDPQTMLRIVALLFNEKERDYLAHLAQSFDQHGKDYAILADWAFGQLAELDNDPQSAIDSYVRIIDQHADWQDLQQPVPEGHEQLLEEALSRIAHLQLNSDDPQQALETLALLTDLSIAHAPRQARMLGLLGRYAEGIALLHAMLDRGACDWRVVALLGSLYERSGSKDSAEVAYSLSARMREGRHDRNTSVAIAA